jgi:hypothetical protein
MDIERGGDVLIAIHDGIRTRAGGRRLRRLQPLRDRGEQPEGPSSEGHPDSQPLPSGKMAVRQDEECRGSRSAALLARFGIGIGGRSIIKLSVKTVGWLEPTGFADMVAARCR